MPTEKGSVNFSSVGAGIRIKILDQGVLRLEWAAPMSGEPITEESESRFHFSIDVQS